MDIDPVLPPVNAARVVTEGRTLFRHQRISQLLHILRHEVVLIQKNERLEQFDQFFDFFQIALRPRERSFAQRQRRNNTLDRLNDRFLRRR